MSSYLCQDGALCVLGMLIFRGSTVLQLSVLHSCILMRSLLASPEWSAAVEAMLVSRLDRAKDMEIDSLHVGALVCRNFEPETSSPHKPVSDACLKGACC